MPPKRDGVGVLGAETPGESSAAVSRTTSLQTPRRCAISPSSSDFSASEVKMVTRPISVLWLSVAFSSFRRTRSSSHCLIWDSRSSMSRWASSSLSRSTSTSRLESVSAPTATVLSSGRAQEVPASADSRPPLLPPRRPALLAALAADSAWSTSSISVMTSRARCRVSTSFSNSMDMPAMMPSRSAMLVRRAPVRSAARVSRSASRNSMPAIPPSDASLHSSEPLARPSREPSVR